ncbi:MAG TPA: cell division protein DivIVA [Micromonospora sp.]
MRHAADRVYRSGDPLRLNPLTIRTTVFRRVRLTRSGVPWPDVRAFQLAVADHLEELCRQLALLTEENERLRAALRRWPDLGRRVGSP